MGEYAQAGQRRSITYTLAVMRYAVRSTAIARPERPEASRAGARRRGKTQRREAAGS
jgi:hypothetical protein